MDDVRSPTDPYPSSDEGESKVFGLLSTPMVARTSKDGRKAKRALRRRIKPKQQRCSERMRGPIIEQPSRGVPKLPRGGDGLALVSLRPSLGPQGRRVVVEASSPRRRPSTASGQPYQADRPQRGELAYAGGRRPMQPWSAPPEVVGSSRAGLDDGIMQQQNNVTCEERELQKSLQHPQIYPLRPVGEKERARQPYTDAGQRTIRNTEILTASDGDNLEVASGGGHGGQTLCEETKLEPETARATPRPIVKAESGELFGNLHSTRQDTVEGDEGAWCQPIEEGQAERSATVVLSSNVLLSPKGRARTRTLLVGDGSRYSPGIASPDGVDNKAHHLSSTSRTAQGINGIRRPTRHRVPAFRSPNAPQDQLWMTSDADIRELVITKVPTGEQLNM